jgi:hypothetical protein
MKFQRFTLFFFFFFFWSDVDQRNAEQHEIHSSQNAQERRSVVARSLIDAIIIVIVVGSECLLSLFVVVALAQEQRNFAALEASLARELASADARACVRRARRPGGACDVGGTRQPTLPKRITMASSAHHTAINENFAGAAIARRRTDRLLCASSAAKQQYDEPEHAALPIAKTNMKKAEHLKIQLSRLCAFRQFALRLVVEWHRCRLKAEVAQSRAIQQTRNPRQQNQSC